MSIIDRIEIVDFTFHVPNLDRVGSGQRLIYRKNGSVTATKNALLIQSDAGERGEYVTNWVASPATRGEMEMVAPFLIGRDPYAREQIHDDMKRELRQWSGLGFGPFDIALWDLAGKSYNASISQMIGGYRQRLPVYASTYHGNEKDGLDCKEAYVGFAEHCYELGFRAFKVHGWNDADPRREAENVTNLAKHVGDRMVLMLDPACELRSFADALYVGRACDEGNYFWYEDPMRDAGRSAYLHKKLREMLKTPLLMTEYVRGLEPKADIILAGGTDFLRVDPEYDLGITGSLKTAHLGEAFGLDVEIHACGPAHRHLMTAMRNTNYYELALVGPDMPNVVAPVYRCGYTDQLDCVGADGCVDVPSGAGLRVDYDWHFIEKNAVARRVFE